MTAERIKIHVLFCYAPNDEKLCNQLKDHLQGLQQEKLIKIWCDHDMLAGTEREREIDVHLATADIILLLISSHFMASDNCNSQMRRAMERHQSEGTPVIPVLLRPADYERTP